MADPRDLIKRLAEELDTWLMAHHHGGVPPEIQHAATLVAEARAYLAQPEPTLTVEDCDNMHKHRFNFLDEDFTGEIVLDGSFTREDLIEIANTVPLSAISL
jgi:hypothetical protein